MSRYGRTTLWWVGVLLGVLGAVALTGGAHDPAYPCEHHVRQC